MKEKMKAHFLKIGPRRFVIGTVILLTILDLINSLYLRLYWVHKDLSIQIMKAVALGQKLNFSELSLDSIQEIEGVIDNAFFFFLFIILINNLFFYVFYLRRKLWAQGYVLFYTLTTGVLAITFLIEGTVLGWSWFLYNFATLFIYLYLYFGVKLLKNETTDTPKYAKSSPAHETKEQ